MLYDNRKRGVDMDAQEFLGKIIKDTEGREYHITGFLDAGGQGMVLKTKEGFLLKINTSADKEKYKERYSWLMQKGKHLPDETRIAFPIAILEEPHIGYVMHEAKGTMSLEDFCEKPEEIDDFVDWYFNATGGLNKRLQIGYLLAKSLRYLHINGFAYVDLSPKNVLAAKEKNSIAIIDSDNITSGVYKPLIKGTDFYMAPEVAKNIGCINTLTDTYSYAIVLFKLLTACHPFIGDEAEDSNPDEVCKNVNEGLYPYIGDDTVTENKNSVFENTKVFLTDELTDLFRRMFVDGKQDSSKRPTLLEFMKACRHARYKVLKCECEGCDAEYYYTGKDCTCPNCDGHNKKVFTITSIDMVSSEGKILIPLIDQDHMDTLPVYKTDVNYMVVGSEAKYIQRSFFDDNIPFDSDKSIMAVGMSNAGELVLLNYLAYDIWTTNNKMGNSRKIEPFVKGKTKPTVINEKDNINYVFLLKNYDLTTERELIDLQQLEKFYGKTSISKMLVITAEE